MLSKWLGWGARDAVATLEDVDGGAAWVFCSPEALQTFHRVPVFGADPNGTEPNAGTSVAGGGLDGSKPILIRKDDILVFSSWSSHRSEASFGLDPEEFRPERWETLSADVAGFIPFNKGPRLCPGSEYLPIP